MKLGYWGRIIYLVVFFHIFIFMVPVFFLLLFSREYIISAILLLIPFFINFVFGRMFHYIKVKNGKFIIWGTFRKHIFNSEDFDLVKPSRILSPTYYKVCFKNGKSYTYFDESKIRFYTYFESEKTLKKYAQSVTELIKEKLEAYKCI